MNRRVFPTIPTRSMSNKLPPGFTSHFARLFSAALFALLAFSHFAAGWAPGTTSPLVTSGFVVDAANRRDVLAFYNTIYRASDTYVSDMGWTGNVSTGVPGTTSDAFKGHVLRRINYYRAMAGLTADIYFTAALSAKCQQAALMFSANNAISHTPPTNWTWYTAEAAEAASNSNIGLGSCGPATIDGYMVDYGSGNSAVGHRRWILYSRAWEMATGDVPPSAGKNSANALWVFGTNRPSATARFVPWPNAGYAPNTTVPTRWSLSYPAANFGSATVSMTQNGVPVTLSVISRTANGYGDNTIVWEPSGIATNNKSDIAYSVSVSGIQGTGVPSSCTYVVTLFDPSSLGEGVTISGPASAVAGQTFSFNQVDQADAYELRVSAGSSAAWAEGAEDAPVPAIIDKSDGTYALRQSTVKRGGTKAFHLAFKDVYAGPQLFEIDRELVPTASSQVFFYDLFRWATTTARLSLEVSDDAGLSWTEIWGRNGNGNTSSSGWDSAFNARSASLSAYVGRPIKLRFVFRFTSSTFIGNDASFGVFIDDISVSDAVQLVGTTTTQLAPTSSGFSFDSSVVGGAPAPGTTYYMRLRPQVGTRWFGDGALKTVSALAGTIYTSWAASQESASGLASGSLSSDPGGDLNRDGVPNLMAYLLGGQAASHAAHLVPKPSVEGAFLILRYPVDTAQKDVRLTAQASSDLLLWSNAGGIAAPAGFTDAYESGSGVEVWRAAVPLTPGARAFIRLRSAPKP